MPNYADKIFTDIKISRTSKHAIHIGDTPLLKRTGDKWVLNVVETDSNPFGQGKGLRLNTPDPATSS